MTPRPYALVIHGGAGVVLARLPDGKLGQYEASLARIINEGFEVLARGRHALDAVVETVEMLENDPLFNAGIGAALNFDGIVELDAAVMDGMDESAGAVAGVHHVKNPVRLARRIMEKTSHVLLVGSGAEEFALAAGEPLVPNRYFITEERRRHLESEKSGERGGDLVPGTKGTVGAVALDADGNLAAATSTGGLTNKLPGRVGDSPIIGAGTYAKNGVCAVSATGHGESFIRSVAAHRLAMSVEYRGFTLRDAASELLRDVLPRMGGLGGVIAVGATGEIVMDFNTEGMFRAAKDSRGTCTVGIGR